MSATASLAVTHLVPLAGEELDKNKVTPGVLGFIVFAVIGAAVWLLMKSMTKHMKKVDFEEAPEASAAGAGLAAAAADPSARGPETKPAKG